jgi:hypothetical protein
MTAPKALEPIENMALTIALGMIERGDEVPPNTTACLVFALARLTGREGYDIPESGQGE